MPNNPPTAFRVPFYPLILPPGTVTNLSYLFGYYDSDPGDAVTGFAVELVGDGTLTFNGINEPSGQLFDAIPISQISQWSVAAGSSTSNVIFYAIDSHNVYSPSATVTITGDVTAVPDFTVPSLTVDNNTLLIGPNSSSPIHWTISHGPSNWSGDVFTYVYLSTDNIITTDDISLGGLGTQLSSQNSVAQLGMGPVLRVPPGNYYIGVIVDPFNQIIESNELNNTSVAIPITVIAPN